MGALTIDLYLPALPGIAGDLGSSEATIQLTITTFLVGLGVGQLVAGPLSDRFGRRLPLLAGTGCFAIVSLGCAFAPSAEWLIGLRLFQGLAGAFGIVIARAVVRDLFEGREAARVFSALMLVFGLAPVLAPLIGTQILVIGDWQEIFLALGVFGLLITAAVATRLPETLPVERRPKAATGPIGNLRMVVTDRRLLAAAVPSSLALASMMAYIAASPFVLQEMFDLSTQLFALIFGANALGLVVASQVGAKTVHRWGANGLLKIGLALNLAGGITLLLVVLTSGAVLWAVLVSFFMLVTSLGLVTPNALAAGLENHPERAGSAAAVFGLLQYLTAAAAAPLAGLEGSSLVPLALVIGTLTIGASALRLILHRPESSGSGLRPDSA
jgi:DHA1 family bicyclomycin/chloramphenicol resistance-like MFS transporter